MESPPKGFPKAITEQAAPERLGKYPLLGVIGKGSMGVLYKSVDPHIKRAVALKTIRRDLLEDDGTENFSARFRNEAQAAGSLAHPGIVSVYEYGEDGAYAYIAMEYVEGRSLRECFEQRVAFSVTQVVDVVSQLLEALQYAHERGVWHRDIKPANILIQGDGRVKVTDFGIARIESSMLTQVGAIMGTPGFIAPEMYLGDTFDSRIDVFAAGVVLYQLLAGAPPFTGTAEKVMFKVCYETPVPPSVAGRLATLQPFDGVVMRALAREPGERFTTAAQFLAALKVAHGQFSGPGGSDETIIRPRVSASAASRPSTKDPASQPPASQPAAGQPAAGQPAASQPRASQPQASQPQASQPQASQQPASQPPASQPPSTSTLTASGWDMDELARLEKRLAQFVGPVAKVMVRRAASSNNDIVAMTLWLAGKIQGPADRDEFLKGAGVSPTPAKHPARRSSDQETIPPGAPVTPARTARPLTPDDVNRAAQLLAVRVGPIAPVLAKRAAKPGCSREQFIATLAAYLTDDGERARFLAALD
ncbi:MAG TPA: protein kinase [Steroidobacteraceae bacterium]|nr:protein kinase [Steroidobacteraceae bacterium]